MWATKSRVGFRSYRLGVISIVVLLTTTTFFAYQPASPGSSPPISRSDSSPLPSPLANISDNPAYKDNFSLTASFEAKMQFPDGGIDESEDIHYLNTDNTLEAIWIWSRYYTLTRDNKYRANISAAWTYAWAHPAWLETDSGKIYSCAWALKAELEFRRAYGDRSQIAYANRCATYIINRNGWEPNLAVNAWGKNDIRGLAAGSLFDWAVEQGNSTARQGALKLGNDTMAAITANSTWLVLEDWALAGGVAYWGIVHSTFREYPNVTWAEQYGALLKTNVSTPGGGAGNSQCGWYAWYALGHFAAWEATGNTTHLNQSLGMIAWLIMQDGDRDGGIPTNFGEPNNTDESWVTSYRALDLAEILRPWLGQPPDPPALKSAYVTGPGRENLTITWNLSLQDSTIGDVVRYDVWRGTADYDASGIGYSILASVPLGTANYTDRILAGDPSRYFYFVKAVDSEWFESGMSGQAGRVILFYFGHWGHALVSNPFIVTDDSVGSMLSGFTFSYVRAFDPTDSRSPWSSYIPGRPYQSLTRLPQGLGFWLNISTPTPLIWAGLIPRQVTLQLKAGWNLVGYCSMQPDTVAATLAGISWDRVQAFGDLNDPYHLRDLLPTETLFTAQGFWVHVTSDATLTFDN